MSIEVGTTYNELGATATDNYDDNNTITSTISALIRKYCNSRFIHGFL